MMLVPSGKKIFSVSSTTNLLGIFQKVNLSKLLAEEGHIMTS